MDPVRLAFDVGPLHGHRTGVGVTVAALVDALAERSEVMLQPYLLSFRTRPQPPVRRLPAPAAMAHRSWSVMDRPRLDRWLGDADVVHGTNYVVPPSRRPRIVSVYDCWFLAHPELASPQVRRVGRMLHRAVQGGAWVHASSDATAEAVRRLLGTERVTTILLGPPPRLEEPDDEHGWISGGLWEDVAGTPFVLTIGTWERRKNLPHLVRAFGRADLGDTMLVLAGAAGDDSAAVAEAVLALAPATHRRVRPLGAVDDDTKTWLLRHARALAYPSLDEGFGFPILEAQAVDLPVVATRVGSIPEIAGAGAELVNLGDVDALAGALERVVSDDRRRRELVSAGRDNLGRFSWAATADGLVELYLQMRSSR